MLWLIIQGASHQIISCNIHEEGGKHQLWITRPNGKSMKVFQSEQLEKVSEIKDAIDYAVEMRESTLRLV